MRNEKARSTEKYVTIMLCPDCVRERLQTDPRVKTPDYPVCKSVCSTHLITKDDINPLTNHPAPDNTEKS